MEKVRSQLRTIRDLLDFAVKRFNKAGLHFGHGCDNAFDEAAFLILHTLRLPLDQLEPHLDRRLTQAETSSVLNILQRRVEERIPAAYLTNQAWLGDFTFYVDERVIVPRSHIAGLLSEQLSPWITDPQRVSAGLDLCTGAACLAILMTQAFPNAKIDATDISLPALEVARRNVADYDLQDRIEVIESDLFGALKGRSYDVIVSNPPYVTRASMEKLPKEYRHEPREALAGGKDGLDFVRRIVAEARAYLNEEGMLVVEVGDNRDSVEAAFRGLPFVWVETSGGDGSVFLITRSELTL
ncbi:MAG: 50S ribosomal protein L3 N(5)-glutamine methyltransferase [Burkholderiales bacterium]